MHQKECRNAPKTLYAGSKKKKKEKKAKRFRSNQFLHFSSNDPKKPK